MTEFTPGPWKAEGTSVLAPLDGDAFGRWRVIAQNPTVNPLHPARDEASARLMAAAPDMHHLLTAVAFDTNLRLQPWLVPLYRDNPYAKLLVDKATALLQWIEETP